MGLSLDQFLTDSAKCADPKNLIWV